MKIEPKLSDHDIEQITRIHMRLLPDGMLTELGSGFVKEFYSAVNADPYVFIFVERSATGIVGFVTGGISLNGVKLHFRKNLLRTFWLIKYSLFRPKLIVRLGMSIKRSLFKTKAFEGLSFEAELYSLVVDPSLQRKGVASKLYDQLCNKFKSVGVHGFEIVVGADLKIAQMFYGSKGAVKVRTIKQGLGKRSFVYAQILENKVGN